MGDRAEEGSRLQLELTRGKRAQGKAYVDPGRGTSCPGWQHRLHHVRCAGRQRGLARHLAELDRMLDADPAAAGWEGPAVDPGPHPGPNRRNRTQP